jgi:PAS domain S-box-containing protein
MDHESYRVLCVEDDIVDQLAFERFIQRQALPYTCEFANSVEAARELLSSRSFDVALLDYNLGHQTALDLFEDAAHLPIIIVTGSGELSTALDVMKAGAFDYITKDLNGDYLTAIPIKIKNTIERWRAQQELVAYRTRLEQLVEKRTAALYEEQARLRTVVESTPTIVFSLDNKGHFRFIAGNTEAMLGIASRDLIGHPIQTLSSQLVHLNFNADYIAVNKAQSMDVQINNHWLSISVTYQQNGQSILGVIHDVTKRKTAELEAIQERNMLRTIIDNIPDFIFVKDQHGRFLETNLAHAEAVNLTREEMLGRHASEIYDPNIAQQFHDDDDNVLQTGQAIINEERLTVRSNSEKMWVLTTKIPLQDAESRVTGLVGISRDSTQRRRTEQERLEAEHLRIEIERERAIVDLKQRFVTTATHDFRTPLSIIRASTSILERYGEKLSSERQQAKYSIIQKQIDRMVHLLDDILEFGKVSSGRLKLNYTTFDIKLCCQRLWDDMVILDEGEHRVEFQDEITNQLITADEIMLYHAVVNLLSNAFKYTPSGKLIRFHLSNDEQWFRLAISDEGIGIPESDFAQLFQPFHRAKNVADIQGTGLGLAIAKEYIGMHGGTIDVESEENKGTTFIVRFPYQQSS